LGDIAIGVSKYSPHREEAVAAVRYLASAATQAVRARQIGSVPTLSALYSRHDIMDYTPLSGSLSNLAATDMVVRPSVIAGKSYDKVSRAYFTAIHAALTRQVSAREALGRLEEELVRITGLPPCCRK
jgi:trehalose/maltose transport system substrate-binding protein